MLLEINVLISKRIIVNLNDKTLIINNCRNLIIDFKITIKNNIRVRKILKTSKKTIIDVNIIIKVFIYLLQFLSNKNYLFESKLANAYNHIVDFDVYLIYVSNINSMSIIIDRYVNFDHLTKYEK